MFKKSKRGLSFFLIACLLAGAAYFAFNQSDRRNVNPWAEVASTLPSVKDPHINAKAVALIDQESGRILYAKNARLKMPMASTTKIMTAIVILEKCKMTEKVVVSKNAAYTWGSDINLKPGEVLTVRDLLYGLLLKSGNDAAVALAEYCGGSVEGFAKLMNRKAAAIGAVDSAFVTPHGLDEPGHFTTALDLAIITRYALNNKTFSDIVSTKSATIKDRVLNNTNSLLSDFEGADGVKTGYTGLAGKCLVASATRDGRRYIAVALGSPTSSARAQTCANLLDYGFDNYKTQFLFKQGESVSDLNIDKGVRSKVPVVPVNGQISIPVANGEELETRLFLPNKFRAPVAANIEVGDLDILINGKLVSSFKLKTSLDSNKKGFMDFMKLIWGKCKQVAG